LLLRTSRLAEYESIKKNLFLILIFVFVFLNEEETLTERWNDCKMKEKLKISLFLWKKKRK